MSKKQGLARSQEGRRIEGRRILARIIARHCLTHSELYPAPMGGSEGGTGSVDKGAPAVNAPARADEDLSCKEAAG